MGTSVTKPIAGAETHAIAATAERPGRACGIGNPVGSLSNSLKTPRRRSAAGSTPAIRSSMG